MPPVQTTYQQYMNPLVLGQIVDSTPNEIVSRNVATVAGIQFGVPVFKGAVDKTIVVAADAGAIGGLSNAATFEGFTVLSPVATPLYQPQALPGTPAFNIYPYQSEAGVLKRGAICVTAAVAVTPASVPAIDPATGNIVTTASGVANAFAIPGASFQATAAAGTLVALRIF